MAGLGPSYDSFGTSSQSELKEGVALMALKRKNPLRQQWQLKRGTHCIKWATLPEELLEQIVERLPLLDRLSFGRVCKWWRCSTIDSKYIHHDGLGLPWLMLSINIQRNLRGCFSVLENKTRDIELPEVRGKYLWGSVQDWLITVDERDCFLWLGLFNPFAGVEIHLPEIYDDYFKAVLSSTPKEDCVVMLIRNDLPELAYWVMGTQNWRSLQLGYCGVISFNDGVFYNGNFYFLGNYGDIIVVEAATVVRSFKDSAVEIKPQFYKVGMPQRDKQWACNRTRCYLVESCGEVLLVRRIFGVCSPGVRETLAFEVFKLDVSKLAWIKLEGLGDSVLFINHCGSRSYASKELGKDMHNHIYFSNDHLWHGTTYWRSTRNYEMQLNMGAWGFYNLTEKCFGTSFQGDFYSWGSVWITAPLWWYQQQKSKIITSAGFQVPTF